jgi:manganese/zinc/iron transport system substrate-binding protein
MILGNEKASFSMRQTGTVILLAMSSLLLVAGGCRKSDQNHGEHIEYQPRGPITIEKTYSGNYPIKVVCTTGMVADLARNVGGKHVEATQIMGADVDPHLYKANSGDIARLNQADLIFYSGLHLEGKMTDIFDNMAQQRPVFPVAEYFPVKRVMAEDEGLDPHVWFDVSLWNEARGVVQEVLTKFDPKHAADYQTQGAAYKKELDELHAWAKNQIATIPKNQRVLITAHDAFRYFGKAYDIDVRGIQGISTESEASVKHVAQLVDHMVANKVKAVFVESSVNDRNVKSLIEGCSARGHTVTIGGTLYSDAMGAAGTPEGTYPGMVRHNVNTIVQALR